MPSYVNAATVFLNGWKVAYLRNDHEVEGLFVSLGAIALRQGTLSWQAVGELADQNFDDGYSLCYHFTAIGWNSSTLAAIADHEDEDNHEAIDVANDTTALSVISGFLQDANYPSGVRAALLPRGFGARWEGSDDEVPDHHLLQLAYNLDYAERFVDSRQEYDTQGQPSLPSSASQVDINVITRDSKTIFKDNALRRDRSTGEAVSVLAGADVGYVQPPFSVLPREDGRGLCSGAPVSSTTEIVVENVPFTYAIPVLTGWDLAYLCNDQHVAEMGVWLETFRYTRPVVTLGGGTLRYTVSHVLRDHNSRPGSLARARVHILGFKPILTQGPGDGPVRKPGIEPPVIR